MKQFKMTVVDWAALALIVVGAINWGLVGVAHFVSTTANWNFVNILLGGVPAAEFAVYILVGLAGLYAVYFASRIAGVEVGGSEPEIAERTTPK